MPRRVAIDDLIDAHDVARILGLAYRNSISEYQARYADMPRPVLNLGRGRPSCGYVLRSSVGRPSMPGVPALARSTWTLADRSLKK